MSRATAVALTIIRVDRGSGRPSEQKILDSLASDRSRISLGEQPILDDFALAGPYPILVDGRELDEYVVWER